VRKDRRHDEMDPNAQVRTLWHSQYDLESCSVEYEFYLGDESDGSPRRSPVVTANLS